MEENKVMVTTDNGITAQLISASQQYCSYVPKTPEEQAILYNAMANPTGNLRENVNVPITITDVYAESVQLIDEATGEVTDNVRIVLICKDGTSYACVSKGVFSAVRKLIQVFGRPTWPDGIAVAAKIIPKGENQVLTLTMV